MSLLRYPGGKTRARKVLGDIVSTYFDLKDGENVYSPFFGGGSFELYLISNYNVKVIANDKFSYLITFWKCAKNKPKKLVREIKKIKHASITKDVFNSLREQIQVEKDSILIASYFSVLIGVVLAVQH